MSLHCRIEDQDDIEEEDDEEVVGVGGHVGEVVLEESFGHGLAQDVSSHAAVDTWCKLNIGNKILLTDKSKRH